MKTLGKLVAACAVLAAAGLYLANASWPAPEPEGERFFIAHRGVHQTFYEAERDAQTCTAVLIEPPRHTFIENTIPAIAAAFAAGAAVVEIDIHPTTDGEFAVFHDWTLDCRTDGDGVTRQRSMAYIRTLDAGYGYTADGGATYPLRGTGVGAIPTLGEVLDAFPERRFLINFKSDDPREADLLSAYLAGREADLTRLTVYGRGAPVPRFLALHPEARGYGEASARACLTDYLKIGWSGRVPPACHDTTVLVPRDYVWAVWGWPRRFQNRMAAAGSEVWMINWRIGESDMSSGLDTRAEVEALSRDYVGGVWTNRIEAVGPDAPTD